MTNDDESGSIKNLSKMDYGWEQIGPSKFLRLIFDINLLENWSSLHVIPKQSYGFKKQQNSKAHEKPQNFDSIYSQ